MAKELTVKKVPAESVPYGEQICTRGHSVWAVYDEDKLLGVYATAAEAKRKHSIWPQRDWQNMERRRYGPGCPREIDKRGRSGP